MKHFVHLMALGLSLTSAALAGPLQKDQIPADAKWLLHLDVDDFRGTKAGNFLVTEVLQKQLRKPLADLKRQFQFELDPTNILQKIKSITAYGTDYHNPQNTAVLLIKTDPDLQTVFVGALAGMALAGTNGPMQVEQTQQGDISFYALKDQIFFAVNPGKWVLVGKTREITQKALDTLTGKTPSMKASNAFSEFQDVGRSFFFLGVAEGFSADDVNSPQAKLLQMADGGRVVLGENAGQLFVNLALKAKTAEVVTQMQQVIQGLIALASLSRAQNKDIADLIQSIKVAANNKTVSLSVEYPVDRAIEKFGEVQHKSAGQNGVSDKDNDGKPEAGSLMDKH